MSTERYYVKRPSGKILGPFDKNAITMMLKSNRLGTDAQISQDKEIWTGLDYVPEFAQILGVPSNLPSSLSMDLPAPLSNRDLPSVVGRESNLPSSTRADGLPSPLGGANFNLPQSTQSPSYGDVSQLPAAMSSLPALAAGLPQSAAGLPQSAAGLPQSAAGLPQTLGGYPTPDASAGVLPPPLGGVSSLPSLGNMPPRPSRPTHIGIPGPGATSFPAIGDPSEGIQEESEDLFGDPLSVVHDGNNLFDAPSDLDEDLFAESAVVGSEDLFGGPLSMVEDDASEDLFGGPLSETGGDDLFGVAPSMAVEDDLFGGPLSEASGQDELGSADFGNVDFGQAGPSKDEDMFGGAEDDLFSSPPKASDDLFADEELGDDFLSGDQGFSFLDEGPSASPVIEEDGEDLFADNSPDFASSEGSFEDIDDFEVSSDSRAPAASSSRAPTASPSTEAPGEDSSSGMMASSGIKAESADGVKKEGKRRGLATNIGLPILIVLILVGGCYALYTAFSTPEASVVKTVKKGRRIKLDLTKLKGANFAELREIINSSKKAKMSPAGMGKVLLAHALVLANHDDPTIAKGAEALAQKVKGAKDSEAQLGLGAYTALTEGAQGAKSILEPLFASPGEMGMFAHLFMGVALSKDALKLPYETKSKVKEAPIVPIEEPTSPGEEPTSPAEKPSEEGAAGDEPVVPEAPEPTPEVAVVQNSVWKEAMASLNAANAVDATLASFWIGRLEEHASHLDLAKAAYKESITKSNKEYVPSLVASGRLAFGSGDLNEAKDSLEVITTKLASRAHPHDKAEAHEYLGRVWVARRKDDLAIKNLTKSLELDSSRVGALRALAESYENAGMYKEALSFFKTNKSMGEKDPDVILGVVRAHKGLKQWPQAISQLEVGQSAFPEDARFPEQLGQLNMSRGTFFEAQKAFERAVEIDPKRLDSLAQLAQLAWLKENRYDFAKGEEYIKRIVAQPNALTAPVAVEVAKFYEMAGKSGFAKSWYKAAIKRDPNLWLARLELSTLLLKQNETKAALRILERSRKEGVEDMRLTANLADAYRQSKSYDRAIDEINRIIEKDPKASNYVFIRGRIHFDRKNYDTAKQDFLKAYELDSGSYDARFYVGRTAYEQGDVKTAVNIYREVLDYVPNNGDYRFRMARALEKQGRLSPALEEYRRVSKVDPTYGKRHPELYIVRGRLAGRMGLSKQGRTDLDLALKMSPKSVDALIALGEMEFDERNYDEAIELLTNALGKQPKFPDAQRKLGMAYIYKKRSVEGARRLQLAIRYGYADPDIYRTLGFVYKELGQRGQALNAFQTFITKVVADKSVSKGIRREALQQIKELGG